MYTNRGKKPGVHFLGMIPGQSGFDRGDARDPLDIYCAPRARYRGRVGEKAVLSIGRRVARV